MTAPGFESTTFESQGYRANHGATTMAKMSNKTFSFSKPCFTQQSFKLFSTRSSKTYILATLFANFALNELDLKWLR